MKFKTRNMDFTKQNWVITNVGEPNPLNANCGYHDISIENGLSIMNVWFSDSHEIKTKEDALSVAKLAVCAPELLQAMDDLVTAIESNKLILAEEIHNAKQAIEKATKINSDGE